MKELLIKNLSRSYVLSSAVVVVVAALSTFIFHYFSFLPVWILDVSIVPDIDLLQSLDVFWYHFDINILSLIERKTTPTLEYMKQNMWYVLTEPDTINALLFFSDYALHEIYKINTISDAIQGFRSLASYEILVVASPGAVSVKHPLGHVGPLHKPDQRLHHLRHRWPEFWFSLQKHTFSGLRYHPHIYKCLREVVSEVLPGHTRREHRQNGTGTWQGTGPWAQGRPCCPMHRCRAAAESPTAPVTALT